MLASRKDRQEIRLLYEMPPNPSKDLNTLWKSPPTLISVPCNDTRQRSDSHTPSMRNKASDQYNPYGGGRMKTTLKTPGTLGKRDQAGGTTSLAGSSNPRKRVKLESRPPLGPEIIDIDHSNRDGSSPDPLENYDVPCNTLPILRHDRETTHAFDLDSGSMQSSTSNAVASTSRLPKDGPSTKSLERDLLRRRDRSSSPIEEFEDNLRKSPPRLRLLQKSVKERVHDIEEGTIQHKKPEKTQLPYVDLRLTIRGRMKPKSTLDPVATSSSGFTQKEKGRTKQLDVAFRVLINAFYIGSKFIPEESCVDPPFLEWNRGGYELSIMYTVDKQEPALIKLHTKDMTCVEFAESSPPTANFKGMPVVTIETNATHIRKSQSDPASVNAWPSRIAIMLDTGATAWKTSQYDDMMNWLKTCGVVVRSSRNGKQMWEMAERLSNASKQDQSMIENASEYEGDLAPQVSDARPISETRSDSVTTPEVFNAPESGIVGDRPFQPRRSTRHVTIKKPRVSVDPDEVILIYPQGMPGAINITNADISRLQPGEFLNDTIIEFGLKLWHRALETSNPGLAKDVHVFSSFFYKKLNKRNFEEGYQSVRKWTSKINLFEKKYIVIPINEHLHWYLAMIYMPQYILQPPPPQPVERKLASRTRSRAGKPTTEAEETKDSPSPASAGMIEAEDELRNDLDEFQRSCTITVLEDPAKSLMNIDAPPRNPESPAPHPHRIEDEFSMEVDKTEEDAVREQLQMASPVTSDLGTDDDLHPMPEPTVEDMEIERGTSGEQNSNITSRFFSNGVGAPLTGLDSSVQEISEKSVPELEPQGEVIAEEDPDDQAPRDDSEQEGDEPDASRTYIFTLDSLGTRHPQAVRQLNRYLKMEALHKLDNSNTSDAINKTVPVPTQPNFCDCGIYLLHFAQTFMTDPAKYFKLINGSKKSPPASDRQAIWQDHKVGTMRQELADRIKELSEEWKKSRAAKQEAKKDQTDTISSSDSEIEYVEAASVPALGKGRAAKDSNKKNRTERTRRLRG